MKAKIIFVIINALLYFLVLWSFSWANNNLDTHVALIYFFICIFIWFLIFIISMIMAHRLFYKWWLGIIGLLTGIVGTIITGVVYKKSLKLWILTIIAYEYNQYE